MKHAKKKSGRNYFERLSTVVTRATGSASALVTACLVIFIWAITGPMFHYSDTWQLVINTSTTIITFIMVFIIQHSQNKDTTALHLKLNELLASDNRASNRLINIEDLTEEELQILKKFYITLSELAQKEKDIFSSHSIDEAEENARIKNSANHRKTRQRE